MINGNGLCYNCRLRENNYRQVENNFTFSPKSKRDFIDIEHYNKLSQCYLRCAECEDWGNTSPKVVLHVEMLHSMDWNYTSQIENMETV